MSNWEYLFGTQAVSVATVDGMKPMLRPMTLICFEQRLFLATGKKDAKVGQLAINPHVEIMLPLKDEGANGYLRIACVAKTVSAPPLKKQLADFAPFIYDYWQDPLDEDCVIYELLPEVWRLLKPGDDLETVSK
jgi:uncharacterized pyridoxamine 5'-phosphate oxidase family protein